MKVAMVAAVGGGEDRDTLFRLAGAARTLAGQEELTLWLLDGGAGAGELFPCQRVLRVSVGGPAPYCGEGLLTALTALYREERPQILLLTGDTAGSELAVRLSCRVVAACATGVCGVEYGKEGLVCSRMVYNANLKARFALGNGPAVLAVSTADFALAEERFAPKPEERAYPADPAYQAWCLDASVQPLEEGDGLSRAKRVVVCGHGMGGRENMPAALNLCGEVGGALAGTRSAAIDGWVPPENLVGISGVSVAPELCIVLGASGAQAFTAGIRGDGLLVGVNRDENAPLFQICDAAVVADCVSFADTLAQVIREKRRSADAGR